MDKKPALAVLMKVPQPVKKIQMAGEISRSDAVVALDRGISAMIEPVSACPPAFQPCLTPDIVIPPDKDAVMYSPQLQEILDHLP